MENQGLVNLRWRRSAKIHLTLPGLTFLYLELFGGVPVRKKTPCINIPFSLFTEVIRSLPIICIFPPTRHLFGLFHIVHIDFQFYGSLDEIWPMIIQIWEMIILNVESSWRGVFGPLRPLAPIVRPTPLPFQPSMLEMRMILKSFWSGSWQLFIHFEDNGKGKPSIQKSSWTSSFIAPL